MKKKQLTSSSSIIVRMIEKGYTMTREGKLFSPKGVEIIVGSFTTNNDVFIGVEEVKAIRKYLEHHGWTK